MPELLLAALVFDATLLDATLLDASLLDADAPPEPAVLLALEVPGAPPEPAVPLLEPSPQAARARAAQPRSRWGAIRMVYLRRGGYRAVCSGREALQASVEPGRPLARRCSVGPSRSAA